jgi:hypothetical protein
VAKLPASLVQEIGYSTTALSPGPGGAARSGGDRADYTALVEMVGRRTACSPPASARWRHSGKSATGGARRPAGVVRGGGQPQALVAGRWGGSANPALHRWRPLEQADGACQLF